MYPFYLGIDLHLKRTYLVLMNAEGEVIDKRRLKNTEMASYISKNIPKEIYAVMEATRNWPFLDQRGHLNRKLRFGDCYLLTVRGEGYKLNGECPPRGGYLFNGK